ncbi:MAG: hypothetical protein JHC93_05700 [Parachlamydiales bacterium]|nr:hypothetical protein [Parachlamydiales bacterium]
MPIFSSPKLLGLESNDHCLKGALLSEKNGSLKIEEIFNDVKPLYISKITNTIISSSLSSHDHLLRLVSTPKIKNSDQVATVLGFQLEPDLPINLDETHISYFTPVKPQSPYVVFITTKLSLQGHIDQIKYVVESDQIHSEIAAIQAFDSLFISENYRFYIHLNNNHSSIVLLNNNQILAAHTIPALQESQDRFTAECYKIIRSLQRLIPDGFVSQCVITGNVKSIDFDLISKLNLTPVLLEEKTVSGIEESQLREYAVAIGCAILNNVKEKNYTNFRTKEFSHPHPIKQIKQPLKAFFSIIALSMICIWLISSLSYNKKEKQLYDKALQVLAMQKTLFPDITLKNSDEVSAPALIASIRDQNTQLQIYPFSLCPQISTPTQILKWISDSLGLSEEPVSKINKFNYTLVKRPTKKNPKERYQVKVDLDFSCENPRLARQFYEVIMKSNDIINTKEEIRWNVRNDSYSTSFILKDQTYYP